jgi:hypothetical protein
MKLHKRPANRLTYRAWVENTAEPALCRYNPRQHSTDDVADNDNKNCMYVDCLRAKSID